MSATAITPVDRRPAVSGATLLLVDDNAAFRDMTEMALRSLGYAVEPCSSPEAALGVATRSASLELLITDVVMANMNGLQLATEIRRIHPETKVLFCSGYPAAALLRQGLDCGTGEFLMKPVSLRALSSKIDRMLSADGMSAPRGAE